MKRTEHAKEISNRFREIIEQSGDSLPEKHYNELALLIEAGIDTALVDKLETVADNVEQLAQQIRRDAEKFS